MSLESDIKLALDSLVSSRVYPDVPPDNPVFPLIIYQQVGGEVLNPLEGAVPAKDNARMQVVVWAKTRLSANTIARQARVALCEGSLKAYAFAAPVSEYEPVLKLYGSRTDYGVWFTP